MTLMTQTISLDAEQHTWLKAQPAGISGTIRILVGDAMARAAKKRNLTKADLAEHLTNLRQEIERKEAELRDATQARLEAEQRAEAAVAATKTIEQREAERQAKWVAYRDANREGISKMSLEELKALKDRVGGGGD